MLSAPSPHSIARALSCVLAFASLVAPALAARPAEAPTPATPFPSVVAFANAHRIPLDGLNLAAAGASPQSGDRVTLLLTLFRSDDTQQWLVSLEADDLTAAERQLAPLPDDVLYSSADFVLRYPRTRTPLLVRFIGPFSATSGPKVSALPRAHRVLVSPEHLSFGLDRYAHVALELSRRAAAADVKLRELFHIGSGRPLAPEQLARGQRYLEIIRPTEDEERRVFGVYFALNAFLATALEIGDFKDVLEQVLAKPSLWSVVSHAGLHTFLEYDQDTVRPLDFPRSGLDQSTFGLPVQLHMNGRPALLATLAMTAPRPPLQVCAGLVAIATWHPTDPRRRLQIEVVAARPAPRPDS